MMKRTLLVFTLSLLGTTVFAQTDSLRNETHIFWSENYEIQIEDFQDTIKSTKNVEACEKYNLCWGAYTGLFTVMDVPRKKKDKKRKEEVIYFAPAFELKTSYRLTSDSMDYLKQVLVFDMYELAARKCRMELDSIYNTNPSIGIKGIFFKSVEADVQENLGEMVRAYTHEVYIEGLESAYEKWRTLINDILNETREYRTTAKDRTRFIKEEPLLEGYVRARKVIGNLFEK
jgi:hypothetical protein